MGTKRPEFIVPDFMAGMSAEEIQGRMMNMLPGDIDDMPGGFPYDLTMPTALVASELVNFHLARALMIAFPQYAWGKWLDIHGETIHVKRHEATHAAGRLRIIGKPGTRVSAGRIFSTVAASETAAVEFRSTREAEVGEEGYVTVPIEAVMAGKSSNVGADTIILQNKPLDGVTSVTNPEPVTGGAEIESDEDYFARIQLENETLGISQIGNDNDYKRWALSVDGVGSCTILPAWNGPGTVKLVLVDSNGDPASEELAQKVYDYIVSPGDRSQRLLPTGTAELTVAGARTLSVSYQCTGLVFDPDQTSIEQIKKDFVTAVEAVYQRARDLGEFVYHQAEGIITNLPGVSDYEVFLVNGAEEDILLAVDEYPKTAGLDFS